VREVQETGQTGETRNVPIQESVRPVRKSWVPPSPEPLGEFPESEEYSVDQLLKNRYGYSDDQLSSLRLAKKRELLAREQTKSVPLVGGPPQPPAPPAGEPNAVQERSAAPVHV